MTINSKTCPTHLPPHDTALLNEASEITRKVATVDSLASLLSVHSDPIVRHAIAEIRLHALCSWKVAQASKVEPFTAVEARDTYTLPLEGEAATVEIAKVGGVLATHLKLRKTEAGHWLARSDKPGKSGWAKWAKWHWGKWHWALNGEPVAPDEERAVKSGDVISIGPVDVRLLEGSTLPTATMVHCPT